MGKVPPKTKCTVLTIAPFPHAPVSTADKTPQQGMRRFPGPSCQWGAGSHFFVVLVVEGPIIGRAVAFRINGPRRDVMDFSRCC